MRHASLNATTMLGLSLGELVVIAAILALLTLLVTGVVLAVLVSRRR